MLEKHGQTLLTLVADWLYNPCNLVYINSLRNSPHARLPVSSNPTQSCPLYIPLRNSVFKAQSPSHYTTMTSLAPNHFLSLPRPDITVGHAAGVPDTSTLAAHDFDVDTRTGFLPPQEPLNRLPADWEAWESVLDDAAARKLQLGHKADISLDDVQSSATWRARVAQVSLHVILIAGSR